MQIMLLLIRLKLNKKKTGKTGGNGTKDVEIIVLLKYLSKFWITLEVTLIHCKINLDLNWSKKCLAVRNNAD